MMVRCLLQSQEEVVSSCCKSRVTVSYLHDLEEPMVPLPEEALDLVLLVIAAILDLDETIPQVHVRQEMTGGITKWLHPLPYRVETANLLSADDAQIWVHHPCLSMQNVVHPKKAVVNSHLICHRICLFHAGCRLAIMTVDSPFHKVPRQHHRHHLALHHLLHRCRIHLLWHCLLVLLRMLHYLAQI